LIAIARLGPKIAITPIVKEVLIGGEKMSEIHQDHKYSKNDLERAYTSGLEYSITILEKMIGLSSMGQREMLEVLRKLIAKRKVKTVMTGR